MLTRTPKTVDLQELEELWELPAKRDPRVRPESARFVSELIVRKLAIAWPVLLFALIAFEPAPEPAAVVPWWGELLSVTILMTVLAGIIGRFATGPRLPLGFFSVAGALGIAAGVACRAASHHLGAWWIVETALFGVLAVAAWTRPGGRAARPHLARRQNPPAPTRQPGSLLGELRPKNRSVARKCGVLHGQRGLSARSVECRATAAAAAARGGRWRDQGEDL